jgi:hypothetical protein
LSQLWRHGLVERESTGERGSQARRFLLTYAPALQRLFDNESIPLGIWPWLLLGGLVFFVVVEVEELIIRSSGSLRTMVTAVEAGT